MDAEFKPVQTGTQVFVEELKTRHFPSADTVIIRLKGHELTIPYLKENGFDHPILIESIDGLGIKVPHESLTVQDIQELIGAEKKVRVIDVATQGEITMRFADFVSYFNNPTRLRVLNLISLEFSSTKLNPLVEAPLAARDLDWANTVWPSPELEDSEYNKPEVQKYCLIGAKDSYTDFHIDFGGTSVWYHVLTGEKVFYLIEPTNANLSLFTRWYNSTSSNETFFGDQVDQCYSFVLKAGNTMLIPTGWIHAVLTPVDTLVFGGNFLHNLNIPMQLRVYDIEKKTKTPVRYRYPGFQTINWYAARSLCNELQKINEQGSQVPTYLLHGVKALLHALKQWNQERDNAVMRSEPVPPSVQGPKLIKSFSKEIRTAERILNSLNPPKPERESKRKKKKPVNKDFVDYPYSLLSNQIEAKQEPKEPLKLSMKVLNKKSVGLEMVQAPVAVPRPPLKLTLPKPVMYPYTSLSLKAQNEIKLNPDTNNKSWFISNENLPNVVIHPEEKVLKVKISKISGSGESQQFVQSQNVNIKEEAQELLQNPYLEQTSSMFNGNHQNYQNDLKPIESIYDFHDESDETDENCLMIDESPKKKKWSKTLSPDDTDIKIKSPKMQNSKCIKTKTEKLGEPDSKLKEESTSNGIEELIKASSYAKECSPKFQSGRTSPSTREAIAGMLSISQMGIADKDNSSVESDEDGSQRRRKRRSSQVEDFFENMDKVHQDEDYIYPSLDLSDEEEPEKLGKPNKRKVDEPWNPKARVGHVAPKTDRPCREGAKKQAVEKGLEAAAAKRATLPPPKRSYFRKKPKLLEPQPSSSVSSPYLQSPMKLSLDLKGQRKPKKGMATAKQRLGRILKIHKMMH